MAGTVFQRGNTQEYIKYHAGAFSFWQTTRPDQHHRYIIPRSLFTSELASIGKIFLSAIHRRHRHFKFAAACLAVGGASPLALGFRSFHRSVHLGRSLPLRVATCFAMPPSTRSHISALHSNDDDDGNDMTVADMTVVELKSQLKSRDLPVSGVKAVLIQRLEDHQPSSMQSSQSSSNKKSKYFTNRKKPSTPVKGAEEFGMAEGPPPKSHTPSKPSPKKKKSPSVTPERKGSAVKTPTKRKSQAKSKSTSPRKKRIRTEPGSLDPPPNWERIYKLVEELRSDRSAPVDTDGGEELPEKHLGPVVHRFQVLTALMLSSQTKDAVVGETMRILQKHGLTVENIHSTDHETLNSLIGKVGFHNNKTKFMKQSAEMIISQYNSDIPLTAEEMQKLPGVGPKMAYIVEHVAFGTVSGIGVDTHMHRML